MTIEYKQPTKEEFSNIMDCFWIMLRECETSAHNEGDPVLKHWVEGFYEQWNAMQVAPASNLRKPCWKE